MLGPGIHVAVVLHELDIGPGCCCGFKMLVLYYIVLLFLQNVGPETRIPLPVY